MKKFTAVALFAMSSVVFASETSVAAEVVAPVAEVVAPVAEVVAPAAEVVAPAAEVVAPAAEVVAPAAEVVAPVSLLSRVKAAVSANASATYGWMSEHPVYSAAITAVVAVVAYKTVEYALSSNDDEEAGF